MGPDRAADPGPGAGSGTAPPAGTIAFTLDGSPVAAGADGSLLDALRSLGVRSVKDGCAPQGQCGCCTVLVDGAARVACVTPVRRVRGRAVTTPEAVPDAAGWADAFCATGASQCGFCTPGIVARLAALTDRKPDASHADVEQALLAHLCRCTGWRTILDAWDHFGAHRDGAHGDGPGRNGADGAANRDLAAAGRRASIESGVPQRVDPAVALGHGGFADDTAPSEALVAILDADGAWTLADSVAAARAAAGTVQGRRTTTGDAGPPIAVPDGDWDVVLQTSWVDPAYLETDTSWATPASASEGPADPLANGGDFGAKRSSPLPAAAADLASQHGTSVVARYRREDVVRRVPKRPPLAAGLRDDGTGTVHVARTAGIVDVVAATLPGVEVVEVDVAGPPTSTGPRRAGWAEAAVLAAVLRARSASPDETGPDETGPDETGPDETGPDATLSGETGTNRTGPDWVTIDDPDGGWARARVTRGGDGAATIEVDVDAGAPLDEIVLRSFTVGAAHQALSWVTSESLTVDDDGAVHDLTIRSFGVVRAVDTPPIVVTIRASSEPPVPASDAVFVAVAAAVWLHQGLPPAWPTGIPVRSGA